MVTIKDIAKRAGVSRGTVDRVLNNRPGVNPETEARVRALIEEMGYRPNMAGQMLAVKKRRLHLSFLIFHGPEFVFHLDILHAARDKAAELREFGVTVDFFLIRQLDTPYLEQIFRDVEESHPDGIAALPLRTTSFMSFIQRMHAKGVPTVFFNLDEDFAPHLAYVGCDYVHSGRVAAGLTALCTGSQGQVGIAAADGPNSPSFAGRMGGFSQELTATYPGLTMVDGGMPALFRDGDFTKVVNMVEHNPDMKALYIVNMGDYGVCQEIHRAARGRNLSVITHDLAPAQQELLKNGLISATIVQQPDIQGSMPLQMLYDYLAFGTVPKPKLFTDLHIYIRQSV
ncbi:MAG: LacI family transcriptional regulator [Pseudoflavonifractor capillosus]|uniref:LacI family DNA-binding transcriptional regulator n=1 Tax=Pseudoflavonifractor capillosus TaxID=106588 RepID=UPI0023F6D7AD|nr:LacI family DNA-binding transcriptional regulator [Pseudoflavonifractor capillosus]MCI5927586.1 LacI family transcriptional regulator [Pseudoflavonifractor capillosus]MDY4660445.1 LacI family DNA-binding transcriptional regulator [Pseudoflavonifractor capillosus]